VNSLTTKQHILRLLALLAWSVAVQAWTNGRSVAPAQDAVRFIAAAQAMQLEGFRAVAPRLVDEPLYPAAIGLAEAVLRRLGHDEPQRWVRAAQWAAAVPVVLTVVPLYLLLLALVPPGAAWLGTLFFASASEWARLGADAVSDPLYVFLAAATLCLAVRCAAAPASARTWLTLALAGMLTGAALAVHRAAWLLAVAMAAGWAATCVATRPWQRPHPQHPEAAAHAAAAHAPPDRCDASGGVLRRHAAGLLWLALGWLPLATICWWVAHGQPRSAKPGAQFDSQHGCCVRHAEPSGAQAVESAPMSGSATLPSPSPGDVAPALPAGLVAWSMPTTGHVATRCAALPTLGAGAFAKKDPQTSLRFSGLWAAVAKFASELPQVLAFGPGVLVLLGLWAARRGASGAADHDARQVRSATIFAAGAFAAYSVALVAAAQWLGYLAGRHLMPLAMLAMGWAGQGALAAAALPRWSQRARSLALVAVVAGSLACCFARLIPPLHESRRPHRAAGLWLAEHAPAQCAVVDTRGFTALYSGRTTYPYEWGWRALLDRRTAFVVIERHELQHDSTRSRTLRALLETAGELVAEFSPDARAETALEAAASSLAPHGAADRNAAAGSDAAPASRIRQPTDARSGKNVCVYRWHPERLAWPLHVADRPDG
jgi:hypothetical protein